MSAEQSVRYHVLRVILVSVRARVFALGGYHQLAQDAREEATTHARLAAGLMREKS